MSLVYDALQKAEREKERRVNSAPAPVVPVKEPPRTAVTTPVVQPPVQSPRNYLTALIVCVSLVAVAAIVYIVMVAAKSFTEKQTVAVTPPTVVTDGGTRAVSAESKPANLTEQAPPAAPASSTANDPRFQLTGIMKMGENYGAVINGRIVYETQYVDGAIVKKVERDRVTLNVDNREIVVRLF